MAISPRIVLVPIVPDLFFGRSAAFFAKIVGNLRALTSTTIYIRGKIWRDRLSPPRVGYRKSDQLLFLNMLKNKNRRPVIVLVLVRTTIGPIKTNYSSIGDDQVQIGPIGKKTVLGEIES